MSLVDVAGDDGVATLTLNRPDKRNALSSALLEALRTGPAVRKVLSAAS